MTSEVAASSCMLHIVYGERIYRERVLNALVELRYCYMYTVSKRVLLSRDRQDAVLQAIRTRLLLTIARRSLVRRDRPRSLLYQRVAHVFLSVLDRWRARHQQRFWN